MNKYERTQKNKYREISKLTKKVLNIKNNKLQHFANLVNLKLTYSECKAKWTKTNFPAMHVSNNYSKLIQNRSISKQTASRKSNNMFWVYFAKNLSFS